jgi:UDP-N-acetylmuramoylalanine--D-glutamate ligase
MADESGQHIQVGGNLGTPALDLIVKPSPDFYILELSSFQLETVKSLNAFVATVLNVSPDHLDRYDCEQDYIDAKATIFNGDGVMVLNSDDPHVMQLARDGRNQIQFSLEASDGVNFGLAEVDGNIWLAEGKQVLLPVDELMIKGKHNVANALAALAIGSAMGLSMSAMVRALKTYPGLPHRCRLVKEINNVRWFNDSKATNVGACVAAIEGLADSGKMILIAGGVGKDQDFSELTAVLKSHVREIIVLGHDAELIAKEAPAEVTVHRVATLKEAVSVAYQVARAGEIVLLSPACASFDMFSGYAERGEKFETLVREIS